MNACANIKESMQKYTSISYETSDQHKDMSSARQARDVNNTLDVISYLWDRDPFVNNTSVFNIANGMSAADNAREIGENILSSMVGESVDEF